MHSTHIVFHCEDSGMATTSYVYKNVNKDPLTLPAHAAAILFTDNKKSKHSETKNYYFLIKTAQRNYSCFWMDVGTCKYLECKYTVHLQEKLTTKSRNVIRAVH